jgi:hypothetical protein
MDTQREGLGLVAMCAIVILLSVLGLVSAFVTGLVTSVDGLLLLMICLMMGGLFTLMLLLTAKDEGWLPGFGKKENASGAAPAKAKAGK